MYNLLNIIITLAHTTKEALVLDWTLGTGILANLGNIGFLLLVIALSVAVASGINGLFST